MQLIRFTCLARFLAIKPPILPSPMNPTLLGPVLADINRTSISLIFNEFLTPERVDFDNTRLAILLRIFLRIETINRKICLVVWIDPWLYRFKGNWKRKTTVIYSVRKHCVEIDERRLFYWKQQILLWATLSVWTLSTNWLPKFKYARVIGIEWAARWLGQQYELRSLMSIRLIVQLATIGKWEYNERGPGQYTFQRRRH